MLIVNLHLERAVACLHLLLLKSNVASVPVVVSVLVGFHEEAVIVDWL